MKNILINPKISINKDRKEINDVIDHALINWLIKNSFNPIVISNKNLMIPKKKSIQFLKSLRIRGIVLSGGNDGDHKNPRYKSQVFLINYAKKNEIPILGICQGMQMLGYKFGSKLKDHIPKIKSKEYLTKNTQKQPNKGAMKSLQEIDIINLIPIKTTISIKNKPGEIIIEKP